MTNKNLILHNPRCSKSRQALALLAERGVDVEVVDYLGSPPTPDELRAICTGLGMRPLDITRTKEPLFGELGLSPTDARSDDEWIAILAANPRLIERPIVRIGDRYALGRPPENVLAIL